MVDYFCSLLKKMATNDPLPTLNPQSDIERQARSPSCSARCKRLCSCAANWKQIVGPLTLAFAVVFAAVMLANSATSTMPQSGSSSPEVREDLKPFYLRTTTPFQCGNKPQPIAQDMPDAHELNPIRYLGDLLTIELEKQPEWPCLSAQFFCSAWRIMVVRLPTNETTVVTNDFLSTPYGETIQMEEHNLFCENDHLVATRERRVSILVKDTQQRLHHLAEATALCVQYATDIMDRGTPKCGIWS